MPLLFLPPNHQGRACILQTGIGIWDEAIHTYTEITKSQKIFEAIREAPQTAKRPTDH